jgi:hypothetical protein
VIVKGTQERGASCCCCDVFIIFHTIRSIFILQYGHVDTASVERIKVMYYFIFVRSIRPHRHCILDIAYWVMGLMKKIIFIIRYGSSPVDSTFL